MQGKHRVLGGRQAGPPAGKPERQHAAGVGRARHQHSLQTEQMRRGAQGAQRRQARWAPRTQPRYAPPGEIGAPAPEATRNIAVETVGAQCYRSGLPGCPQRLAAAQCRLVRVRRARHPREKRPGSRKGGTPDRRVCELSTQQRSRTDLLPHEENVRDGKADGRERHQPHRLRPAEQDGLAHRQHALQGAKHLLQRDRAQRPDQRVE